MQLETLTRLALTLSPAIALAVPFAGGAHAAPSQDPAHVVFQNAEVENSVYGKLPIQNPIHGEIPGVLTANFVFSSAFAGEYPRGFDVLWRVRAAGALRSTSVREFDWNGVYTRQEWYGDHALSDAAGRVIAYDPNTGTGQGFLSIPLGRGDSGLVYPPASGEACEIEIHLCLSGGGMTVDHSAQTVSGSEYVGTITLENLVPVDFAIQVPRTSPVVGERACAYIVCRQESAVDRTFYLGVRGSDIVFGTPGSVTVPAGESLVQLQFAYSRKGAAQLTVSATPGGAALAVSPVIDVGGPGSGLPNMARYSVSGGQFELGSSAAVPYDMSMAGSYFTSLDPQVGMYLMPPDETVGAPPEEQQVFKADGVLSDLITSYDCVSPTVYGRNAVDLCGECHEAPLAEADKPDCPNVMAFWWPAHCKAREVFSNPRDCYIPSGTVDLELNNYDWTGSRGEYACATWELSFGELLAFAWGTNYGKSCCTYKKNGTSGLKTVPDCSDSPATN